MKKLIVLISLLLITVAIHAQEPQNYVIIDQPTNVRAQPRMTQAWKCGFSRI